MLLETEAFGLINSEQHILKMKLTAPYPFNDNFI